MSAYINKKTLYLVSILMIVGSSYHNLRTEIMSNNKENKTTSSQWILDAKEMLKTQGEFSSKDMLGNSIILEWEKIDSASPHLPEKIKSVSDVLIPTYTQMEMQFTRKHPEAVHQEHFLKSLEPLFKDGIEKVDWDSAEKQVSTTIEQFFTTTDFAKHASGEDIHLFIIAKDEKTKQLLGVIQFLITREFKYGHVKAAFFGVIPDAQERGLEKILMSSIFVALPTTKRIFLHTRVTNEDALSAYRGWGFSEFDSPMPYWANMEYWTDKTDSLQETAKSLTD